MDVPGTCTNPDCTVADTGLCVLLQSVPGCPNFQPLDNSSDAVSPGDQETAETSESDDTNLPKPSRGTELFSVEIGASATTSPADLATGLVVPGRRLVRRFHSGHELGTEDASGLMRTRYVHLIGILGPYDAGKTCFLSALYLMASHGGLGPRYQFAGSLTLQGFEERSHRARQWPKGRLPEQLAEHTHLASTRQPGLLHFALRAVSAKRKRYDLLLTDLPGEWSQTLITRVDAAERFAFLHRADGIIVMTDGMLLANVVTRAKEISRMTMLLRRLRWDVKLDPDLPVVLLITKCDQLQLQLPPAVEELRREATNLGFTPRVIPAAAYSVDPETVPNGAGIIEALEHIIRAPNTDPVTTALRTSDSVLSTVRQSATRIFQRVR